MIAGTRIPVYMLADLKAQAVNDDVLLADYPSLTQALLTQALLYAQLHPRAGRPKQPDASWRKEASDFRLAAGGWRASRVPNLAQSGRALGYHINQTRTFASGLDAQLACSAGVPAKHRGPRRFPRIHAPWARRTSKPTTRKLAHRPYFVAYF